MRARRPAIHIPLTRSHIHSGLQQTRAHARWTMNDCSLKNPDFAFTSLIGESGYGDRPLSVLHLYALLTMTVLAGSQVWCRRVLACRENRTCISFKTTQWRLHDTSMRSWMCIFAHMPMYRSWFHFDGRQCPSTLGTRSPTGTCRQRLKRGWTGQQDPRPLSNFTCLGHAADCNICPPNPVTHGWRAPTGTTGRVDSNPATKHLKAYLRYEKTMPNRNPIKWPHTWY